MYLRIYKAKNKDGTVREYLQIVATRREKGWRYPRQRLLLNVARIDGMDTKTTRMLFNLAQGILKVLGREIEDIAGLPQLKKLTPQWYWGLVAISFGVWQELGLESVLRKIAKSKRLLFSFPLVIFAIVVGRLYGRISELAVARWLKKVYDGFGITEIAVQSLYRALDILEENWVVVEERLKGRVLDLFHQSAEVLFIDTTSLIYWGEGDDELTRRGFSKEKRGDKKQVVIGVALVNGLPVGIEIEPGNTADVKVMRAMISRLKMRFDLREICIVADSGMVSIDDLDSYNEEKWKYLVRAKGSEKIVCEKVRAARESGDWVRIEEGLWAKSFAVKPGVANKEWLIVLKNEIEERYAKKVRESILATLKEKEGWDIKGLINNKGYKRYLVGGGEIRVDERKVRAAELWDGIWVVRTNKEFSELKEVVTRYKELWRVERVFKDLKNLLRVVPIYHSRRVRGYIYACFLSLLLGFVIQRVVRELGVELPYEEVLEELKDLRVGWIEINKKRFLVRDELNEWQVGLFKRLKIPIPPAVMKIA